MYDVIEETIRYNDIQNQCFSDVEIKQAKKFAKEAKKQEERDKKDAAKTAGAQDKPMSPKSKKKKEKQLNATSQLKVKLIEYRKKC